MARQKTMYKLVGRYVIGNDTIYYALISENGKEVRYTEEQMAFIVGREQVINVRAQLYQNKVLFRGVDCDIRNLPTISLGGEVKPKPIVQPQPKPVVKPVQPKPQPKPVVQPQPKPIINTEPKKFHPLSEETLLEIGAKLGKFNVDSTYEAMTDYIVKKYSNLAYNLEETLYMRDMECKNGLPSRIRLICHKENIWYIEVDIWDSTDTYKLAVSETTLKLIRYEYPHIFTGSDNKTNDLSKYKYCHYHELIIRIGAFSRIPQYKKLKLQFAKYNTEIFNDKIPHDLILMLGEYKDGTHFDDLEGCAGYSKSKTNSLNRLPLILFKYRDFDSVDNVDNLSRSDLSTLLHEMAHAYVDAVYGSNWETDPSCMGDVLYGINKNRHPEQYKCHGKRFGTTVQMVSDKTGLSFDEIFCYGVHFNNTTRNTEYTSHLGPSRIGTRKRSTDSDQLYTNKDYTISRGNVSHKTWNYKKSFENIKKTLIEKQDNLNKFFVNKFNMQIIFNITADESRVVTIDSMGNNREYDINFYDGRRGAVLLYRMLDNNNSVMIHSEYLTSTPSSIIKKLLEKIYIDSITD